MFTKRIIWPVLFLLALCVPALASLPQTVTASGAGTSVDNGTYTLSSATDANGNYFYYNASSGQGIVYSSNAWQLARVSASGTQMSGPDYVNNAGGQGAGSASFPQSGWSVSGGAAPAPAFGSPAPAITSFTASPASVAVGGSSTLSWSTANATSANLASGNNAASPVAVNGSATVTLSQTTTYTLTAVGVGGSSVASTYTVQVLAPSVGSVAASPASLTGSASASQTVTLTATLSSPAPSGGATINWSSTTAGGFTGNVGFTASQTIPQGSSSCTETATVGASSTGGSITFIGTYGGSSQSATVTVGAPAAASPPFPPTLYVYGAGNTADNGTYKLIGPQAANSAAYYYTLNGVTSGSSGPGLLTGTNGSVLVGHINAATGGNAAQGPPYADYGQSAGADVTSAGSAYTPFQSTPGSYAPGPTVSTTPQSTGGGGGGVSSPSGPTGSPGVSISASPYTIGPGGSSVLRWDTSGATTVTVTGVANPSSTGTMNVSPGSTTTYTVTATNSYGTNSQTVTVTVDSTLPSGTGGTSSFTPGSTVSSSGGSFTGPTLPGLTISPVTLPGYGNLPGLTIPGINLPPISLPGLNIPGLNAPGDLKIGIPGIGSISISTGWLSQLIAAAINPASIAGQLATYTTGQFNALATYNAGAAVTHAVDNGTATLVQINTASQNQNLDAHNQTMSVLNATSAATQGVIKDAEKAAVTDFQSMLLAIMQQLFDPDPSVLNQFETEKGQFLDWGPYHFITAFQTVLNAPPGDGTVGGVALGIPSLDVNADAGSTLTIDPQTGTVTGSPGFSWYSTGAKPIPFDFTQVTSLPGWAFVRLMLGGGVWVLFITGVFRVLQPKQVL